MVIGRLQPSAGPGLLGAFAFAFGIAMIGWQGLWATSISEITGPGQAGTALGIGQMFIQVGIVAGPAILALIIERGGFNFAWTALGVALLVATLPLLLIRNWPVEGRFAVRA
jgi:predicted MFS family arabinose efflux permease